MGEAPVFFADDLCADVPYSFDLRSKGQQTATLLGSKTYVIGGTHDESSSAIPVRIFDKSTGQWIIPTVLGTKPKPCEGHSAVLVNDNRILVIKENSSLDDCIWFLEVDTEFVREQRKNFKFDVVAWSKVVTGDVEKPIVISGPSGVGKGTLISKLMREFPSRFGFSVSHTTRAPRENEKNGIHYHFSERGVMERDIKAGKFLEFASVHGNLYGTSVEAVEMVADAGKKCILDIDVQGARSVRASSLEAIFIFICPPSFEELEKRLRSRGTELEEQIQKRLRNAKAELEQGKSPGLFDCILINDDLEACYQSLKKLLGLAEGMEKIQNSACDLATKFVDIPKDNFSLKVDQKISMKYGPFELDKASQNFYELDLSSLKGGAPGRTRGLNIYASNPSSDSIIVSPS